MKRRPRGDDEGGRAPSTSHGDADETAASETAASETAAAAASSGQGSPPTRRGPGTASVTRERALYFATGHQPGHAASKKQRTADQQNKESWPGYFATARDLGENREAAQAARNEEMMRREREQAGDPGNKEEKVKWVPRRAPRKTVLTQHHMVPRLQDLALRCLAQHIELMPTLEYIDSTTRHRVARAVVELRKMKTEVLPLFMFPGVTEIDIPDCSGIDEATFVKVLKKCLAAGLDLTILRLGLSGRCVSDIVMEDLGGALRSVELLQVQGSYRLSDVGCETLVRRCAPSLQEFEISCNQRITKQSIDYFGELQHLEALTLSECPQLDDASLTALFQMKSLSKLALTQMERISDDFIEQLAENLTELREVSLARCTQLSDRSVRAMLEGCRDLKVLDISDMHDLTDACLEPVRTHSHSLRRVALRSCLGFTDLAIQHLAIGANEYLEILEMSSVAEATDATMVALREHCVGLETLDISFCRQISEDALGVYVDSAENLKSLVLWGCTQITARFLTSHSRDELIVSGHPLLTGLTIRY